MVHLSYDFLTVIRGDRKTDEAVLVLLDERSHKQLNQPLNAPWDRALHAQMIDRLTAAGARVIVFDVVFSDPGLQGPAVDERLAAAIKSSGRVILGADRIVTGPSTAETPPPLELFETNSAGFGSVETVPDGDLTVRKHTPEEELPSLSWVAAEFLAAPATTNSAIRHQPRWMNYYGRPGSILGKSYSDALDPAIVPDEFFRGKSVFVGSRIMTKFAGERKDEYRNPYGLFMTQNMVKSGRVTFMPGVEIQATAFLNLVRNEWWTRLPNWVEATIIGSLGLLAGFVLARLRPVAACITTAIFLAALFAICVVATANLSWFVLFLAAVQIIFAFVISTGYNSIRAYVQKRLTDQTLSLYLPPKLVKQFSKNPTLLKPGANKQLLTLFFSDIADFTKMSDGLDSDHLAPLMNQYFETAVSQCIHKEDGTLVKYIGDAIFAFWNAPEAQGDHQARACAAALAFRHVKVQAPDGSLLHTRIGIHTGDANVGNFGSVQRVDYTALGENVNLASRLEGLNKYLGTIILISGATRSGLGEQFLVRALGNFQLKGFEKPVEVFELVGAPSDAESTRLWRESFDQALKNYQSGEFVLAEMGFKQTLTLRPGDGPSQYYLSRLEEFSSQPVPEDWTGATIMKEK